MRVGLIKKIEVSKFCGAYCILGRRHVRATWEFNLKFQQKRKLYSLVGNIIQKQVGTCHNDQETNKTKFY